MVTGNKTRSRKHRLASILILLWIGWYISGPACETFDFWDSPVQEMGDVARSGSFVVLLGAVAAFSLLEGRKLFQRCSATSKRFQWIICSLQIDGAFAPVLRITNPLQEHSPPLPLRI